MKKRGILNRKLSWLIADLGHKDNIVIADAGLPVGKEVCKIDLAVSCGNPNLISVLSVILYEMKVEHAELAQEIKQENEEMLKEIYGVLPTKIEKSFISHKKFKEKSQNCKAVIRTGECSPYSNIILRSGVNFT